MSILVVQGLQHNTMGIKTSLELINRSFHCSFHACRTKKAKDSKLPKAYRFPYHTPNTLIHTQEFVCPESNKDFHFLPLYPGGESQPYVDIPWNESHMRTTLMV